MCGSIHWSSTTVGTIRKGSGGFSAGFPHGFLPLRDAAARYQSAVGVWLSPFGGYGPKKEQRLRYGRPLGFETNRQGFALAGPRYYARFRDACRQMAEQGANYFKLDGIAAGLAYDKLDRDELADIAALMRLCEELRELCPDVCLAPTTGIWPSPFWLWYGDAVCRDGEDSDFCGEGSLRQQWINYRDVDTQRSVVRRGPLCPLNAVMNQGIMYARLGHAAQAGRDAKDLVDEFRMFFGDGTQFQELYVTPQMMTPALWARWPRRPAGRGRTPTCWRIHIGSAAMPAGASPMATRRGRRARGFSACAIPVGGRKSLRSHWPRRLNCPLVPRRRSRSRARGRPTRPGPRSVWRPPPSIASSCQPFEVRILEATP